MNLFIEFEWFLTQNIQSPHIKKNEGKLEYWEREEWPPLSAVEFSKRRKLKAVPRTPDFREGSLISVLHPLSLLFRATSFPFQGSSSVLLEGQTQNEWAATVKISLLHTSNPPAMPSSQGFFLFYIATHE